MLYNVYNEGKLFARANLKPEEAEKWKKEYDLEFQALNREDN